MGVLWMGQLLQHDSFTKERVYVPESSKKWGQRRFWKEAKTPPEFGSDGERERERERASDPSPLLVSVFFTILGRFRAGVPIFSLSSRRSMVLCSPVFPVPYQWHTIKACYCPPEALIDCYFEVWRANMDEEVAQGEKSSEISSSSHFPVWGPEWRKERRVSGNLFLFLSLLLPLLHLLPLTDGWALTNDNHLWPRAS